MTLVLTSVKGKGCGTGSRVSNLALLGDFLAAWQAGVVHHASTDHKRLNSLFGLCLPSSRLEICRSTSDASGD
jgi:hypothetical protein